MGSVIAGLVLWWLLWRLTRWSARSTARARSSTGSRAVSRNTQSGPKWEQIAPMPECFDDETEDDI